MRESARSAFPRPSGHRSRQLDPARIQDIFLTRLEELERRVAAELVRPVPARGPLAALAADLARESWRLLGYAAARVLQPERALASLALALAARPCDIFGIDPSLARSAREILGPLARLWLGIEPVSLPETGGAGALVAFNRSAWPLPIEPLALWLAVGAGAREGRLVCALWEPGLLELPYAGEILGKLGVFVATADNARALLERGAIVVGFPEGKAAREKTYERRYRLARFEDRFLIDVAIETGAAVIPGAVVGSEESYPVVGGIGSLPVTPVFPLAGPAGLLPLPLRWRVRVGPPVEYPVEASASSHGDGVADALRARIQAMLAEMLAARRRAAGY